MRKPETAGMNVKLSTSTGARKSKYVNDPIAGGTVPMASAFMLPFCQGDEETEVLVEQKADGRYHLLGGKAEDEDSVEIDDVLTWSHSKTIHRELTEEGGASFARECLNRVAFWIQLDLPVRSLSYLERIAMARMNSEDFDFIAEIACLGSQKIVRIPVSQLRKESLTDVTILTLRYLSDSKWG